MPPVVHIMWTTVLPRDHDNWEQNHFIPLIPLKGLLTNDVKLSYADVTLGHKAVNGAP